MHGPRADLFSQFQTSAGFQPKGEDLANQSVISQISQFQTSAGFQPKGEDLANQSVITQISQLFSQFSCKSVSYSVSHLAN